ncbi:hypothetical protein PACTADRAFT_47565 [Pachysolen tannophilus NRRL Y-2460]|uniref:Roadblock/LAMTOR2 domain-containing protein n=1 Tax=Pachysolen tannophilus NRRL Y-2460 TaxID=669874 RepID=A0A1E4U131_PACTA|nr:hypothetical protein PACTADRAFT_47565 [Pachysolen tannophilus NRRL Y-2460]
MADGSIEVTGGADDLDDTISLPSPTLLNKLKSSNLPMNLFHSVNNAFIRKTIIFTSEGEIICGWANNDNIEVEDGEELGAVPRVFAVTIVNYCLQFLGNCSDLAKEIYKEEEQEQEQDVKSIRLSFGSKNEFILVPDNEFVICVVAERKYS